MAQMPAQRQRDSHRTVTRLGRCPASQGDDYPLRKSALTARWEEGEALYGGVTSHDFRVTANVDAGTGAQRGRPACSTTCRGGVVPIRNGTAVTRIGGIH